jgi:hypothetical protein
VGSDPSRSPPLLVITTSAFLSGTVRPGVSALRERGSSSPGAQDSYLVDSASSHMLVSKIKPCMSKYKQSIL